MPEVTELSVWAIITMYIMLPLQTIQLSTGRQMEQARYRVVQLFSQLTHLEQEKQALLP